MYYCDEYCHAVSLWSFVYRLQRCIWKKKNCYWTKCVVVTSTTILLPWVALVYWLQRFIWIIFFHCWKKILFVKKLYYCDEYCHSVSLCSFVYRLQRFIWKKKNLLEKMCCCDKYNHFISLGSLGYWLLYYIFEIYLNIFLLLKKNSVCQKVVLLWWVLPLCLFV